MLHNSHLPDSVEHLTMSDSCHMYIRHEGDYCVWKKGFLKLSDISSKGAGLGLFLSEK